MPLERDATERPASRGDVETLDDERLLARYHEGDLKAFSVLLARYQTPLYNFVLRSVRDASAAEDLVQDVFAKVVQRVEGFQGHSRFSTWLFTIARNLCVDHARKMRHRRHPSLSEGRDVDGQGSLSLQERVPASGPGVDRLAAGGTLRERIAGAVEGLPDDQREVFLLRQVQQLAFSEIASVVGAPENTVKSRMRYALERLQAALADYQESPEAPG